MLRVKCKKKNEKLNNYNNLISYLWGIINAIERIVFASY